MSATTDVFNGEPPTSWRAVVLDDVPLTDDGAMAVARAACIGNQFISARLSKMRPLGPPVTRPEIRTYNEWGAL